MGRFSGVWPTCGEGPDEGAEKICDAAEDAGLEIYVVGAAEEMEQGCEQAGDKPEDKVNQSKFAFCYGWLCLLYYHHIILSEIPV